MARNKDLTTHAHIVLDGNNSKEYLRIIVQCYYRDNGDRLNGDRDRQWDRTPYALNNLVITAQATRDDSHGFYAFHLGYDDSWSSTQLTSDDLAHRARSLKAIEKKIEKFNEQFGRASTFGQYVAYVLNAIDPKTQATKAGAWQQPAIYTLGDVAYTINNIGGEFSDPEHTVNEKYFQSNLDRAVAA